MPKSDNWSRQLPRPVIVKDGDTLRRLSDCRAYVLALDDDEARSPQWQRAAAQMLAAAEGGSLEDVVLQFERILIHQNKLVLQDEAGG
jgi:hypothetical protein